MTRPESKYKCGCAPGWHNEARSNPCQPDIEHIYGAENPMVQWLREKHPQTLNEKALTVVVPEVGEEDYEDDYDLYAE